MNATTFENWSASTDARPARADGYDVREHRYPEQRAAFLEAYMRAGGELSPSLLQLVDYPHTHGLSLAR